MNRNLARLGPVAAVALATTFGLGFVSAANATPIISPTGGTSGGNPGGQPLYEVSNLAQGDAFNLTWGGVNGLSATGMVFIDGLSDTDAQIRVMIENTSPEISNGDPRLTSFAISVADFGGINDTDTGGAFLDLADDSNFPGFNGLTDVCAASGNNCAGGGNGGIDAGMSDIFTLDVSGSFGALTLGSFALKVQGGPGGASFELAGLPSLKPPTNVQVPEPATLLLLGAGLAGLGFAGRPRARKA